ncbi:hypothetical protein ONZ51_g5989 [Trametes cubensis]|uniref:Peptidase S53 domain-containing protein n=1 Tax=Trametes cubensis TaxID=1111947 RepID=A0AAD7XB10_9APHY|nr:hypothetical protein ONZ51_g5989 [Trametes cubensis]
MISFSLVVGFAGAIFSVLAFPSPSPQLSRRVLHESRHDVPTGWTLHKRADPDATLPLSIALVQSNLHNLDDYLLDVADPESPNYGKLWTPEMVAETFRPSKESVDVVHSWLSTDGVHPNRIQLSDNGAFVRVNVSVTEAERLLGTEYYVYEHSDGTIRYGCQHGYHLPEHVSRHVDFVTPTLHFGTFTASYIQPGRSALSKRSSHASTGAKHRASLKETFKAIGTKASSGVGCDQEVTLDCIRQLYSFDYNIVAGSKNTVGVMELGQENYNGNDLDVFFKSYAPDQVGDRPKLVSVDGGSENSGQTNEDLTGESNLDFMLLMGLLGKKQPVSLYQIGSDGFFDELFAGFDRQYCQDIGETSDSSCGNVAKSNVISISYGSGESGPSYYLQRTCNEMGKLALAGITFVYASGDDGVSAFTDQCLSANGTVVSSGDGGNRFFPDFPGTCPYLTAVGATEIKPGASTSDPERAPAGYGSGGGFSNVFPRPSWQARAVNAYLSKYAPSYGMDVYNRSGRGYPDVAANGANIVIVADGQPGTTGGTSASAPIFAAMITAVNDARIAAGKSPVGWINPALYSSTFANIFNDITDGNNPGCGTQGFAASPGWDPVTGLGTVNFPRMLSRFMALP